MQNHRPNTIIRLAKSLEIGLVGERGPNRSRPGAGSGHQSGGGQQIVVCNWYEIERAVQLPHYVHVGDRPVRQVSAKSGIPSAFAL